MPIVRRPDIPIAAATTYAALGYFAHHDLLGGLNRRVRDVARARGPRVVRRAEAFTLLSESPVHPILGYVLSRAASRVIGRTTYAPLAASLATFILNKGTRLVVHQQRPPGTKPRRGLDRLGFPSGHTLAATAIAFTTALEISEGGDASERTLALTAAGAYAATMGWTRIALDQHWIDDILGGWAGGLIIAYVIHAASRRRRGENGPRIVRKRFSELL